MAVSRNRFGPMNSEQETTEHAQYVPALSLLGLAYLDTNVSGAVVLLTMAVSANSGTSVGYLSNHLDLAPNLAGTLMGITNGIANAASILGPLVSSSILQDRCNVGQWQTVFTISAAVYTFACSIFIIFGTTETQSWNNPKVEEPG
ncbi:hypothetical protein AAG570_010438 [Ranatra chinensis]|uniref:Inorganic phosphate cotransporter n=1 Tax=Ranatra chinensis TaxID=642074 RepID=A0ABD0YMJ4_9HEMI